MPRTPRAAALVLALALAGCGGQPTAPEPTAPSGHNDTHAEFPSAADYPVWDAQAAESAAAAAREAMVAYVATDAPPDQWWAQLRPLLTPEAREVYQFVDPAGIPATRVTAGAASLVAKQFGGPYLARVEVPTDAGRYVVHVSRDGAGQPWAVYRFDPPQEAR